MVNLAMILLTTFRLVFFVNDINKGEELKNLPITIIDSDLKRRIIYSGDTLILESNNYLIYTEGYYFEGDGSYKKFDNDTLIVLEVDRIY
jgi:hypothetical protein